MITNDIYTWNKSGWREYVLRRGDGSEAGRVTLEGFCGTAARVAANGERWTFRRSGFFTQAVTVQGGGRAALFAGSFGPLGRCEIALDGGMPYRWKATRFFLGEYAWFGADGTALMRFRPASWLRGEVRIVVESGALPPERAVLLALLGGFLLVLANNDTAGAVAVIAAAAAS